MWSWNLTDGRKEKLKAVSIIYGGIPAARALERALEAVINLKANSRDISDSIMIRIVGAENIAVFKEYAKPKRRKKK